MKLTLKVPFKTEENVKVAVKFFIDTVLWSGWNATPENSDTPNTLDCPIQICVKQKNQRKMETRQSLAPILNNRKQNTTQHSNMGA
jgi:hypothetical protein